MRKFTILTIVVFMLLLVSSQVQANVFASKIEFSATSIDVSNSETTTISFILNQAGAVDVKIYNGGAPW